MGRCWRVIHLTCHGRELPVTELPDGVKRKDSGRGKEREAEKNRERERWMERKKERKKGERKKNESKGREKEVERKLIKLCEYKSLFSCQ